MAQNPPMISHNAKADFVAKFARLGSVEQDQARKTYERAILDAEAELKRLRAALKI
jgi:hypothetical protein